jgi:hypothetical protein
LEVLKIEFRRVPGGETLTKVNGLGLDSERSHDGPDCGLVEAGEASSSRDGLLHISTQMIFNTISFDII